MRNDTAPLRVLVFGAGVLGSLYAARPAVHAAAAGFVLVPLLQRLMASPIMDIGGKRHALAAREEMTALNEELLALAEAIGMDTPMMRALHRYSDPAVAPAFTA